MAFDFLLFDWDGTLAKTLDIWLEAHKSVCEKRRIDISSLSDLEIVEKSFGLWAKGLANLGIQDGEEAYKEVQAFVQEGVKSVDLYNGALETLKTFKAQKKKMALHSSSYRRLITFPLNKYKLTAFFDIILARDEYVEGKPDPEVLLKEIDFLKANKDTTLVIGDSDGDIKAGKAAGIKTVLFYPESNKRFYRPEFLMKENPDYVISDLTSLLEIAD